MEQNQKYVPVTSTNIILNSQACLSFGKNLLDSPQLFALQEVFKDFQ